MRSRMRHERLRGPGVGSTSDLGLSSAGSEQLYWWTVIGKLAVS